MIHAPLACLLLAPEPAPRTFEGPTTAPEPETQEEAATAPGPEEAEAGPEKKREDLRPAGPQAEPEAFEEHPLMPRRTGFHLSVSAGVASCTAALCADILMAGLGRLELGWRATVVAFFAGASFAGGRVDMEGVTGRLTFLDAGAGVKFFPVRQGIVDPWVGMMLGYGRVAEILEREGGDSSEVYARGVVRPSVAFPIAFLEIWSVGPRFDIDLGFAGKACMRTDDTDETCDEIVKILDESETQIDDRLIRRQLPRPWSITFDLQGTF